MTTKKTAPALTPSAASALSDPSTITTQGNTMSVLPTAAAAPRGLPGKCHITVDPDDDERNLYHVSVKDAASYDDDPLLTLATFADPNHARLVQSLLQRALNGDLARDVQQELNLQAEEDNE